MWKTIIVILAIGIYIGYSFIDKFDSATVRDKRVIVTGASKGIGEQLAYNYARLGAHVLIVARSENALKKVVEKCKELGKPDGKYHYMVADLGDLQPLHHVIEEAKKKLGGIDYLVLNHLGISKTEKWHGTPVEFERLHKSFDLNFFSYVHLANHAMPELEKSHGSVIVIGSIAGKIGNPFHCIYSSEKFALDGFFSAWRQELRMQESPVSITYCILGLVDTASARYSMESNNLRGAKEGLVDYANPSDVALDIIKGGANREIEVYTPFLMIRIMVLLRDWLKGPIDSVNRYLLTEVP